MDLEEELASFAPRRGEDKGEWFVAEGRWVVDALLAGNFEVDSIVVVGGQHEDLLEKIPDGVRILRPSKEKIGKILGFTFNRGVLARARRPESAQMEAAEGLIVVCPELADASNLGAIIRCAAAFGATGVAVERGRGASPYARKAIRASSGMVFRKRIWETPKLLEDVRRLR